MDRAEINREIVSQQLFAKGYDEACHSRHDGFTCIVPALHTLDQLHAFAEKEIVEEGEYDE